MLKKIKLFVREYLPDILILAGIVVFSYFYMRPNGTFRVTSQLSAYHLWQKTLGIFLFALGVDLVVRRYIWQRRAERFNRQ